MNSPREYCLRGHPLSDRHSYVSTAGNGKLYVRCRRCDAIRMQAYRANVRTAALKAISPDLMILEYPEVRHDSR